MKIRIPQRVSEAIDRARTEQDKSHVALNYIVNMVAAQHTERGSLRALAERVEMNHSTISIYVRKGAFSKQAAERIGNALRSKIITKALLKPLEVPRDN